MTVRVLTDLDQTLCVTPRRGGRRTKSIGNKTAVNILVAVRFTSGSKLDRTGPQAPH